MPGQRLHFSGVAIGGKQHFERPAPIIPYYASPDKIKTGFFALREITLLVCRVKAQG